MPDRHARRVQFFRRLGVPDRSRHVTHLGDRPHVKDLIGTVKVMLDAYREGKIDRVFLVHNEFVNTMSRSRRSRSCCRSQPIDDDQLQEHWDYIYEPTRRSMLDGVLMRYIESQVYQRRGRERRLRDGRAHGRDEGATDNAGKLIEELQLIYNKARQAAITKEIAEIVGGAAAV